MAEQMTAEKKISRLKAVADGLRRIQEFESARYLDEYAGHLSHLTQPTDEREAFEKWLPEVDDLWDKHLAKHNEHYVSSSTQLRWEGWCAANLSQPAQAVETVRPWPKFVQDECLEVLRNIDTELGATGRKSARIERLINAIAGMPAQAVGVVDEWSNCYSAIIKALAAMVHVGAPDSWPEDAIRRDPIMAEISNIRQALDAYSKLTRAISGEKDGRVDGWKLVPLELTPEMAAAASAAVWPVASVKDREKARAAALIVLKTTMSLVPGATLDSLAAGIATMFPAYRAFIAYSPAPDKEGL